MLPALFLGKYKPMHCLISWVAFTVANTSYKKKQNLCVCLNNKGHIHIAFQLFRNILIEVELLTNCKAVSILEANKIQFKEGDSVRLKMDLSELKTSFLTKNLDHSDIGYIQSVDSDGDVRLFISVFVRPKRELDILLYIIIEIFASK